MGFFNPWTSHVPITHQYRSNSLLAPGGAVNTVEDWNIAVFRAELQPCFIMIKVHGNEGSSEWLWGPLSCFCIFSFIVLFLCLCSLSFRHDNLLFMSSVLFPLSESFPPQFFGAIRCPSRRSFKHRVRKRSKDAQNWPFWLKWPTSSYLTAGL